MIGFSVRGNVEEGFVTRSTNSMIFCLEFPSFHEGEGLMKLFWFQEG